MGGNLLLYQLTVNKAMKPIADCLNSGCLLSDLTEHVLIDWLFKQVLLNNDAKGKYVNMLREDVNIFVDK